jgi:hypothetical protein
MSALGPLLREALRPIAWTSESALAAPASFSEMSGKGRARDAVKERWLRPADMDRATVAAPERVWIPLWRVEGAVDGFHVGLRATAGARGRILPTGGFRHHDGVVLVPARAGFSIDPSERATLARGDMRPFADVDPPATELIQPDVDRDTAEDEARLRLRRKGEPQQALYASVDVKIRSVDLVFLPVWVVRYLYAGEASAGASEYHAAISAHSGALVSERHPPVFGSLKSRIRSWF